MKGSGATDCSADLVGGAAQLLHEQILQLLLGNVPKRLGVVPEPELGGEDVPDFLKGKRVAHLQGEWTNSAEGQRSVSSVSGEVWQLEEGMLCWLSKSADAPGCAWTPQRTRTAPAPQSLEARCSRAPHPARNRSDAILDCPLFTA